MTQAIRIAAAISGLSAVLSVGAACSNNELPPACSTRGLSTVRSPLSISACVTVSQDEVTLDEARALGFPVDDDLAQLAQPIDVPFHRGDFACGTPAATSGQLRITVYVDAIKHYVNGPNPRAPAAATITCQDWLAYEGTIDLRTDEGTLSGSTPGKVFAGPDSFGAHTMSVYVGAHAANFSGTLGIRSDRQREPLGIVNISAAIRGPSVSGQVFTQVAYCDGETPDGDQGDGLFWPLDNQDNKCGWLATTALWGEMMTLDEFNAP